jgi:hypothetical protein
MSFDKFKKKPSSANNYMVEYRNSIFSLPAAPEYSLGETCLASTIRNLGSKVAESDVYMKHSLEGSELRTALEEGWSNLASVDDSLSDILGSPMPAGTQKNPSTYLNLYPLIPQFSYLSNSSRFTGKPWNPGEYLKGMLATCCKDSGTLKVIWKRLFDLISVGENDDIWARKMDHAWAGFEVIGSDFEWRYREIDEETFIKYSKNLPEDANYRSPAYLIKTSLDRLFELKKVTTRRQWVSIFESLLRISMGSHIMWICHLNSTLWNILWSAENLNISSQYLIKYLYSNYEGLNIDDYSDPRLRTICGNYAQSRIGINYLS